MFKFIFLIVSPFQTFITRSSPGKKFSFRCALKALLVDLNEVRTPLSESRVKLCYVCKDTKWMVLVELDHHLLYMTVKLTVRLKYFCRYEGLDILAESIPTYSDSIVANSTSTCPD